MTVEEWNNICNRAIERMQDKPGAENNYAELLEEEFELPLDIATTFFSRSIERVVGGDPLLGIVVADGLTDALIAAIMVGSELERRKANSVSEAA